MRPFAFFTHHQGRGHIRRCEAIMRALDDRPITVLCADPDAFTVPDDRVTIVPLPNMIGDRSATVALHQQATPDAMHCVPLGSEKLRANATTIVDVFHRVNPALFFVDVSAEWTLLARLCSVPAVKVRMHGDRSDPGHVAAYQSAVSLVAPYDAAIEQDDYPAWARRKTFYSGGLCTTTDAVPDRATARQRLGLPETQEVIVTLAGGGGAGTPFAPLTMAARALPDAQWLTIGPVTHEGHETEFANLHNCGWVNNPLDYLAAADVVIASAGDNTVHEIARVGRPFLCIPEWRYFDEQVAKADALAKAGAAAVRATWPASSAQWRDSIAAARAIDLDRQKRLFNPDAAAAIAAHLIETAAMLWERAPASTESNVVRLESGTDIARPRAS
ncbi:MAG: glycosyltransferase [Pseudomonadota bacterium]